MKKVLIFGVSGFVGYYLSKEFLSHGYDIYGSDVAKNDKLPEQVGFHNADLLKMDEVKRIIDEITPDLIINLAAISSVGYSWEIPQTAVMVNVIGALNIMESARLCNPMPRIMFIGSSEEYETSDKPLDENSKLNANNPYGISKIAQENYAKIYRERYGMKIYCVRPFNHTGIGQKESFVLPSFCKQVAEIEKSRKSGIIKVGNLLVNRDFSDVRDIVRGYRMVIESNNYNKIYNIGSGKAYQLKNLLEYIVSLSSQEIHIEIDDSRIRKTDRESICCDFTSINKDLGWEPEYHIKDTLNEIYRSYL